MIDENVIGESLRNWLNSNQEIGYCEIKPHKKNHFEQQKQFRCSKCDKLLAKSNSNGKIEAEIKCIRCGTINER